RLHAVPDQVLPGRRIRLDRACGRDVVGGHAIAQHGDASCSLDVLDRFRRLPGHPAEERGPANVGGVGLPVVAIAHWGRQLQPALVALEDLAIVSDEHLRADRVAHRLPYLLLAWPD